MQNYCNGSGSVCLIKGGISALIHSSHVFCFSMLSALHIYIASGCWESEILILALVGQMPWLFETLISLCLWFPRLSRSLESALSVAGVEQSQQCNPQDPLSLCQAPRGTGSPMEASTGLHKWLQKFKKQLQPTSRSPCNHLNPAPVP